MINFNMLVLSFSPDGHAAQPNRVAADSRVEVVVIYHKSFETSVYLSSSFAFYHRCYHITTKILVVIWKEFLNRLIECFQTIEGFFVLRIVYFKSSSDQVDNDPGLYVLFSLLVTIFDLGKLFFDLTGFVPFVEDLNLFCLEDQSVPFSCNFEGLI